MSKLGFNVLSTTRSYCLKCRKKDLAMGEQVGGNKLIEIRMGLLGASMFSQKNMSSTHLRFFFLCNGCVTGNRLGI